MLCQHCYTYTYISQGWKILDTLPPVKGIKYDLVVLLISLQNLTAAWMEHYIFGRPDPKGRWSVGMLDTQSAGF